MRTIRPTGLIFLTLTCIMSLAILAFELKVEKKHLTEPVTQYLGVVSGPGFATIEAPPSGMALDIEVLCGTVVAVSWDTQIGEVYHVEVSPDAFISTWELLPLRVIGNGERFTFYIAAEGEPEYCRVKMITNGSGPPPLPTTLLRTIPARHLRSPNTPPLE